MDQQLVNQSEFALICGVSQPAVNMAMRGILRPAVSGKMIDLLHPVSLTYKANADARNADGKNRRKHSHVPLKHRGDPVPLPPIPPPPTVPGSYGIRHEVAARVPPPPRAGDDPDLSLLPEDIRAFADLSLKALVKRFGTDSRFIEWLKATKMIEDVKAVQLKTAEAEGELISRDFVKTHMIGVIEETNVRLLNDAPRTIAARVIEAARSGETRESIEETIREIMSTQIRGLKDKITRAIKNA
jgi:hypothetical protein